MLFNSPVYVFLFLPAMLVGYFALTRYRLETAATLWLVAGSVLFYGWWHAAYVPLLVVSICVNYAFGTMLSRRNPAARGSRTLLTVGVAFNIGLLAYFKYADFLIENLNAVASTALPSLGLLLPLAISFFTFQQIAYLVDSYRGETQEYDLLRYTLFVSFFPQLIAGPIVHHREMMGQYRRLRNKVVHHRNIAAGVFVFAIGLFKKVALADTFAVWATNGFDRAIDLSAVEAWISALSYTFQIYFDFSGYTDMAVGSALMFNIRLPFNFASPYRAVSIQDFWRRWHITLSRFLRDYVYIPLGGNRKGPSRTHVNLIATFLIGGLWHGASWTFVAWGALHGVAMAAHRVWAAGERRMPTALAWSGTFFFVVVTWVFFRATSWNDAWKVLGAMFGAGHGIASTTAAGVHGGVEVFVALGAGLLLVLFGPNTNQIGRDFRPTAATAAAFVTLAFASVALMFFESRVSEFLYFNF